MIYLILLLALFLRLWNINQSLWLDEAAQVIQGKVPILYLLQNLQADFHPPLFHIIVHFWMYLGTEEWKLRLLTVILGLISIFFTYLLGKKISNGNEKIALSGALFLAINPFHIYFSQELRPYMLSCLMGILVVLSFYYSLKSNKIKWWVLFIISTVLFIYSSYLSVFLLFGLITYWLINIKRYKTLIMPLLISLMVVGVLYLPWIPMVFQQLEVSSGISKDLSGWESAVSVPFLKALPLTLMKFIIGQINFMPFWVYSLVTAIVFTIYGLIIFKGIDYKKISSNFLLIIFLSGLVSSVVFTFFLPVVAPKRLIFLLPLFILLLSSGLAKVSKRLFLPLFTLISFLSLTFLFIYQTNPVFQREDWRSSVKKIESMASDHSIVVFKFSDPFAPYSWYEKNDIAVVSLTNNLRVKESDLDRVNYVFGNKSQVFVYNYLGELTDPGKITERRLREWGFFKIDTFDFPGVGLVDYYSR